MTAGECRKFWELRQQFGVVPVVSGSLAERAPPARFTHVHRLNITMALNEIRRKRLTRLDAVGKLISQLGMRRTTREGAFRGGGG
jgi:hypothetical protein